MSEASSLLSTYLHPTIKTIEDLVFRTKSLIGFPVQDDELTDAQWVEIISEALENYTTWGGGAKEEYLIFCSNQYRRGCGVKLDDLVSVGCNTQYCNQTVVFSSVTSEYWNCDHIQTTTGYLSVSPFIYPSYLNINDPASVEFSGVSGQTLKITFDPKNPWDAQHVCNANCLVINPISSQAEYVITNSNLTGLALDFLNDPRLFEYVDILATDEEYDISNVPISSLSIEQISALPISYFDLSAFYPPTYFTHPPMEACVEICNGLGYIYPRCDLENISACDALSAQYKISPSYDHIITTIPITSISFTQTQDDIDWDFINNYLFEICQQFSSSCSCETISAISGEDVTFISSVVMNIISGADNKIWPISSLDVTNATHVILNNIPICVTDGVIPLTENNGIYSTINLCNTALCTDGKMYLENIQFVYDYKPPVEVLYDNCNTCKEWVGNGFQFNYHEFNPEYCSRMTPKKVPIDVSFYNRQLVTEVGEVSSLVSSKYDNLLNRPRKVYGVFSMDNANAMGSFGGFGGDMLFNFDYALLASTFGYNLQGSRINAGMGYDLVTYHLARSFVENTKRLLRLVSYTWDERTQYLKIHPEPPLAMQADSNGEFTCCDGTPNIDIANARGNQCYMVGLYLEAPIEELLSTYWVREYTLARAKQVIGTIRAKYTNGKLMDGTWFDANSLLTEATTKIEKLMDELRKENYFIAPPSLFIG